jgi:putative flavoprotein involved in K+ transport
MRFPGPRNAFPTKDEVADYLEAYAARMDLPVRTGIRVIGLWPLEDGHGFGIVADGRAYEADRVVVATGGYAHGRVPDFAANLDPGITQLHSSQFRDLGQLRDGGVLVVGASNSGAEIALMAATDHPTVLAGPDRGKMPIRPESRLTRLFDPPFWFFLNHVATLGTPIGRKALPDVRDHGLPLERVWPADLVAAGVRRVHARAIGARDGLPVLDDGQVIDVSNVIWATGFRPDFGWIHPPVVGADGWPMHTRGVVQSVPGLYFIGLPAQYSAASSLLGGVGRDAAYLAKRMASEDRSRRSLPAEAARAA